MSASVSSLLVSDAITACIKVLKADRLFRQPRLDMRAMRVVGTEFEPLEGQFCDVPM